MEQRLTHGDWVGCIQCSFLYIAGKLTKKWSLVKIKGISTVSLKEIFGGLLELYYDNSVDVHALSVYNMHFH